ncbi:MAG: hypothetical protein EOQ30_14360 [Mesorhizobium sp.]|nr:MAG: hypothetical protein EOQ29_19925 [Mesorhizobium sp.]RWA82905.1 MAG: hypothetical protein EOQ30_14360 [Mesorhizobium sp.]
MKDRQHRRRFVRSAFLQRLGSKRLTGRRDSTPLCPAGHLPRKGGDWQFQRMPFDFARSGHTFAKIVRAEVSCGPS